MFKFRPGLAFSWVFSLVTVAALTGAGAAAQNTLPAPHVGGAGSFDSAAGTAGGAGGNQPARRRLTPLGAVPEDFSKLKLAPGFLLNMEVYDTPEYSMELRIDAAGNVTIPMLAPVHIAGATLAEASAKIAAALRDGKILNNPQVNLNIEEYAGSEVTVLGEVHDPGRIELLAPRRLDEVIAMAGGETEYAGNIVEVRHAGRADAQPEEVAFSKNGSGPDSTNAIVQPGDVVRVRRAGIVYVLGGVARPGGYVMQEGGKLDVMQAIALAYGTTMPAAVGSMRLIRKTDDGNVEQIHIPYRDMVKGKVPPMRLQAEDVIYVPISKMKTVITAGLVNTGVAAAVIYR
jgi:polysaccharide export outer membrane protein